MDSETVDVICDLRVPCPHCKGGAVRLLVLPSNQDHVNVSVMHSAPDCDGSDRVTTQELYVVIKDLLEKLQNVELDA